MRTASLPMYDLPELRGQHARFWSALAQELRTEGLSDVPEHLSFERPVRELWGQSQLFLSQCCGYDVVTRYKDRLRPVATPEFSAIGCRDETYCSLIVVAKDCPFNDVRDMKGTIGVINGPESHSGMSALRQLIASGTDKGRFFAELKVSGSHVASLEKIRAGEADVAAIDSVTLTLLQKHRPKALNGLRVLGTTYRAPAPPFVVPKHTSEADVARFRAALRRVFAAPELTGVRADLLLAGITMTSEEDYWQIESFRTHALKLGFPMVK